MLHADVEPESWWLDKLVAGAEKNDADLLSAVIPTKSVDGLTSTAIARQDDDRRVFCRLTLQQVLHPQFPDTFGINEAADALAALPEPLRVPDAPRAALLVNTGCFICRLDRPWCEQVWFSITDWIEKIDGLWKALSLSEDWLFSRHVAEQGAKVMATRLVSVIHRGSFVFDSTARLGQPRDLANLP